MIGHVLLWSGRGEDMEAYLLIRILAALQTRRLLMIFKSSLFKSRNRNHTFIGVFFLCV